MSDLVDLDDVDWLLIPFILKVSVHLVYRSSTPAMTHITTSSSTILTLPVTTRVGKPPALARTTERRRVC